MKKRKLICIVILCLVGILASWFYYVIVVKRHPAYIHRFTTPSFIEEAEDFYYANKDLLNQLSQLQESFEGDTMYDYTFHAHTFNTPYIPKEFLDIFRELESSTNESHAVRINQYDVTVLISNNGHYEVFLYYGAEDFIGMDGVEKETVLEDGWTIQAPFYIRH